MQESADEPASGAASLVVGVDLDPRQVDLRRPVLDVEHVGVVGGNVPLARGERAGVEVALDLFVPPQMAVM
ncbi:hypothetical protein [Streptomyces atriruber]|uniref:hypothetical protein n=1 Tax=Streptomyces atriruber TaxID=545121 RepID=UPI001428B040|nr:hypothetical protein [Streptomyces atriruber]